MGAMKAEFMRLCQEWADNTNEYYGLDATEDEVAEVCNGDEWFMKELVDETFTDTMPREAMADAIAKSRVGMSAPCYGDSDEYKQEYARKMDEWILNQQSQEV